MKISKKFCIISAAAILAFLVIFEILSPSPFESENLNISFLSAVPHVLGTILFLIFILYLGYDVFSPPRKTASVILCFAVAVNNLPIIALVRTEARIFAPYAEIFAFAVECIFVALFEEFAFRGLLFPFILQKFPKSKKSLFISIIVSSAVFGLFHAVNLIYGESPASVVLQMGYSFLIGCMCAFCLYKTRNIFICALVHAIYNFCGGAVPRLGEGNMLNIPQIILTSVVSLICAIYIILNLIKTSQDEYTF